ncbi:hypothetical protein [Flavobacterium silvaticum]|uniref:Cytochrome c domain-containing protein n=1 Tax=Flavobacterium silvaticum TaxID=1852020 RepID=A0A972JHN3_9FLAO|nr:hypothetical protein [Flavobacterium silvaticum]NMH28125.1 hypothetical protein [Flavobacterium silvaticum]
MKKNYLLIALSLLLVCTTLIVSCQDDDGDAYVPVSPVVLNPADVPYAKLSDYHFFEGALKDLTPAYKVLPYRPASELFTDYAHKKRFVWMPQGTMATYNGNDNALVFPVGAVLIKNFFYDNVAPSNTTRIIETRILIKTHEEGFNSDGSMIDSGWEPYDYIWNEEQTEAYLDTEGQGVFVPLTFTDSGVTRDIYYKIPAQTECHTCHKLNPDHAVGGEVVIPIGVKPQNLNNVYDYGTAQRNQLEKWVSEGYLDPNIPANILSTVDYRDTSQPLELRARSYIDANCAHCHRIGGHCDYAAMRFNFSNTDLSTFGVCMPYQFALPEDMEYVIKAGDANNSELIYRISSTDGSVMMPFIGRSIVHDEGVALMKEWINSLETTCE